MLILGAVRVDVDQTQGELRRITSFHVRTETTGNGEYRASLTRGVHGTGLGRVSREDLVVRTVVIAHLLHDLDEAL